MNNLKSCMHGLMFIKKILPEYSTQRSADNIIVFLGTLDVTQHSYIYMHVEDGE